MRYYKYPDYLIPLSDNGVKILESLSKTAEDDDFSEESETYEHAFDETIREIRENMKPRIMKKNQRKEKKITGGTVTKRLLGTLKRYWKIEG